ncbi:MAG TPA: nuclear transport factor 2 family protein [Puia sp.]|jgi:ketosteroid isomerase-like protein|nr:nuclear transport factor 2 family protein [Puia sp.]
MKRVFYLSIILISFSFQSPGQNPDIETLKKLNRDFLNAIVNRDTTTLSNILADDFMLINPGGIKRNKADNLSNALTPNQKVSVDIDSIEVRLLSGEVGLVTAWTNNVITTEKDNTTFKICYQDVYMKRRNKWVAVAAHVSLLGTQ